MTVTVIQIVIIVILILLSAFFSSAETALTTVSPHKVRSLKEEGVKRAEILEKILEKNEKMLSVILICNNIVNLSASSLMTIVVQKLFGNAAIGVGTGVLTLLVLIFGEVAPKTMATYRAEKISLRYCRVIYVLMIIFTPLAFVVNFLAKGVLRLLGLKKDEHKEGITENELRTIVEVSSEEGVIENEEKDIINNVFDLSDTVVKEIMVPRINVASIKTGSSYEEIMELCKREYYTRLPVMDEAGEKVVGIVNVKDLVFFDQARLKEFQVSDIMREAEYTFEQKHLTELFQEMKKKHCQIMVVLDEYGDFAGIVTMEDLLEEIVGDIQDEYDESEEQEIIEEPLGTYLIMGYVALDDINAKIGTKLVSEDYDSIGGMMIEALGRFPETGESIKVQEVELEAVKAENAHIDLVRLRKL